ncbi:hypothetical protein FBY10_12127 [Pseudomonas sp. SJZ103]|uniref:hypothetical protein n=1 Tax=unclassified Pseudomonas TaxID=196821 RepID=UPI00119E3003|nr:MULTISPECIES: hypothetical protein [unclassified Pseudomonas]NJJ56752.1 hypothetical protein [Pseudomonas sp. B14(2022)]TWC61345.1 hypothetical protein FBY10_12127 [Pseudomonas sp. SJZ103]TWC78641.1 hypothetical protein FBY08_12227 [Pseudomonas sp. SJZ094]
MNRITLAALCTIVPLALSTVGLLTNTDMLAPLKTWANRPAALEHQQAQALRPVIDCLNRVDSNWRVAYSNYRSRSPRANDPSLDIIERFPERYQRAQGPQLSLLDYDAKRPDLCLLTSSQRSALQKYLPQIAALRNDYMDHLLQVYSSVKEFDFYPNATVPGLTPAQRAISDARFFPVAEKFLTVSSELRAAVDAADRRIRLQQLQHLQVRDEHQMALIPGLILQTRDTMHSLDPRSPKQLADALSDLQQSWDHAQQYLRPNLPISDAKAQQLWQRIRQPGYDYLGALQTLARHSSETPDPERLNADYFETQRRFDLLVDTYNQAVGQDY